MPSDDVMDAIAVVHATAAGALSIALVYSAHLVYPIAPRARACEEAPRSTDTLN